MERIFSVLLKQIVGEKRASISPREQDKSAPSRYPIVSRERICRAIFHIISGRDCAGDCAVAVRIHGGYARKPREDSAGELHVIAVRQDILFV